MSLLLPRFFLRRGCRKRRQTFFRDDLHRVFNGNPGDAGILVNPLPLLISVNVGFHLLTQVLLRVRVVPGNTLEARFRRIVLAESGAGGRSGLCFKLKAKKPSHSPPRATGTTRSSQVGTALEVNSGRVIQKRSTRRMRMSHRAIFGRTLALRFRSWERSRKKGTKKWKTTTNTATMPHSP